MASIRLTRREARDGRLPRVCMVCGDRASAYKGKTMSWHPPWVYALLFFGLLPFLIVALVLQKRMRIEAPMCGRHQNHWLMRTLTIVLSLVGIMIVGFGLLIIGSQQRRPGDGMGLICLGIAVLGGLWLLLVAILSLTAVRPTEITEKSITLAGVSDQFVDAVEEYEDEDEDDDYDRPSRQRRRAPPPRIEDENDERPRRRRPPSREDDDYEDDDRPRRRRPPPDAYEERD